MSVGCWKGVVIYNCIQRPNKIVFCFILTILSENIKGEYLLKMFPFIKSLVKETGNTYSWFVYLSLKYLVYLTRQVGTRQGIASKIIFDDFSFQAVINDLNPFP